MTKQCPLLVASPLDYGFVYDPGSELHSAFPLEQEFFALANPPAVIDRLLGAFPVVEFSYRGINDLLEATLSEIETHAQRIALAGSRVSLHGSFLVNDYLVEKMSVTEYLTLKSGSDETKKRALGYDSRSPLHTFWDVVPADYSNGLLLPSLMESAPREKMLFIAERLAKANPGGGILLSRHITTPGAYLDAAEFDRFIQLQERFRDTASHKGVDYALETGGATQEQLEKLVARGFNLLVDLDHLVCDSDYDRSGITAPTAYAIDLVRRGVVAEIHGSSMLLLRPDGKHVDAHRPLHYEGNDRDPFHLVRIKRLLLAVQSHQARTKSRIPVIFEVPGRCEYLEKDIAVINSFFTDADQAEMQEAEYCG